jgi:hypothetical protein
MSKILKAQLLKAMSSKVIDRDEATYIMEIMNITSSMDDTLDFMVASVSKKEIPNSIKKLDNRLLRDNISYSSYILGKVMDIEVTIEELESV